MPTVSKHISWVALPTMLAVATACPLGDLYTPCGIVCPDWGLEDGYAGISGNPSVDSFFAIGEHRQPGVTLNQHIGLGCALSELGEVSDALEDANEAAFASISAAVMISVALSG